MCVKVFTSKKEFQWQLKIKHENQSEEKGTYPDDQRGIIPSHIFLQEHWKAQKKLELTLLVFLFFARNKGKICQNHN
jgi:hypothetical protein